MCVRTCLLLEFADPCVCAYLLVARICWSLCVYACLLFFPRVCAYLVVVRIHLIPWCVQASTYTQGSVLYSWKHIYRGKQIYSK